MQLSSSYQARRLFWLPLLALLLSSCAVMLVGPYDEVTDRSISDLEMKTELFLAKMQLTQGSYQANRSFYTEAKASIRVIRIRAEIYDKNKGEITNLALLEQNLDNLAELHRAGSLSGTPGEIARAQIETNFKALLQIELAKKRSSGVSAQRN
ncbi:MAG: hypothetical protein ABJB09_01020 [Verrucomicrobiota bacterium]